MARRKSDNRNNNGNPEMKVIQYRVEYFYAGDWELKLLTGRKELAIDHATEFAKHKAAVRVVEETTEIIMEFK